MESTRKILDEGRFVGAFTYEERVELRDYLVENGMMESYPELAKMQVCLGFDIETECGEKPMIEKFYNVKRV